MEVELWFKPAPVPVRAAQVGLVSSSNAAATLTRRGAAPIDVALVRRDGAAVELAPRLERVDDVDEDVRDVRADESRPDSPTLDLGIDGASYFVVGPEFARRHVSKPRRAESRLNSSLARGTPETDYLARQPAEVAARTHLLEVAHGSVIQTHSPVLVRFTITTLGTVEGVEVLSAGGVSQPELNALMSKLSEQVEHRSLGRTGVPPRSVYFRAHPGVAFIQRADFGHGSIGWPLALVDKGAHDSPQVEVLPGKCDSNAREASPATEPRASRNQSQVDCASGVVKATRGLR